MAQVELDSRVDSMAVGVDLAPVQFDLEAAVTTISAALLAAAELELVPHEVV